MTIHMAMRAALVWLGIACLAVGNGLLRERIMSPILGREISLPLSGLTLSIIVFAAAYMTSGFTAARTKSSCLLIGTLWLLMTLAFEFLFGYFVAEKSWSELWAFFDIPNGNLFALVLLVSLLSPYVVAQIKRPA
jgi:hypothetical protein